MAGRTLVGSIEDRGDRPIVEMASTGEQVSSSWEGVALRLQPYVGEFG